MADKFDNIYSPKYRTDVYVQVPGAAGPSPVAQQQSLTDESAVELYRLLHRMGYDSKIVKGHPISQQGGAAASDNVPYFQFIDDETGRPGPAFMNAGLLAYYWRKPDGSIRNTPNVALRQACTEIQKRKDETQWTDNYRGIVDPEETGKSL